MFAVCPHMLINSLHYTVILRIPQFIAQRRFKTGTMILYGNYKEFY